jgi:hypothetical protein
MKLYEERRKAPGLPTNPQYRQVLLNEAGEVVWSCIVWSDSEKSEDEADKQQLAFIGRIANRLDKNVEVFLPHVQQAPSRYGVWHYYAPGCWPSKTTLDE